MANIVSWNGVSYSVPEEGEENWAGITKVDGLLRSLATNGLQKTGGNFTLSADVDFGGTAGLKSTYYKSRGTVATAGIIRLGNTESIGWRNAANGGNVLLAVDGSDRLTFAGTVILSSAGVVQVAAGGTGLTSYTAGDLLYASGTTTLAKLAIGLANKVLTTDGSVPSYNLIVNANCDASMALARSKIASGTNYRILANSALGVMSENAALTASHVVFADANGQLSGEATLATSRGGTNISGFTTGDLLYASNATTLTKLAAGTAGQYLVMSGGVPTWQNAPSTSLPTGAQIDFTGLTAPSGWVLASGRTIGNGASGGTERANADTEALFTLLWNSYANAELAVSGGRGANAAADYAANKTIALPDSRGRVTIGKDDMGGSAASRITAGGAPGIDGATLGKAGGVQEVTLTGAQSGTSVHGHGVTDGGHLHAQAGTTRTTNAGANATDGGGGTSHNINNAAQNTASALTGLTVNNSSAADASSAHSNVQPGIIYTKIIKL